MDAALPVAKKSPVKLVIGYLVSIALIVFSWSMLLQLENTGDVYASKRSYPPYLYINDYTQFYAVGKLAASAERARIYEPEVQDKYMNDVISQFGLHTQKICYGQNVPWFFCLMVPFTALPLRESFWLFCWLGIGFANGGLALISRNLLNHTWAQTGLLVLAANATLPAWFALQHGNTSYYLLGWGCLYIWGFLKKRDVLAGIAIAFVAQKPQYAIPMAIPALRYWRWKLIAAAACVELALWAFAAFHLGSANVINYPHILFSTDTNSNLDGMYPQQMVSCRAIYASLISEKSSMLLACGTFATGCLVMLLAWFKVRDDNALQQRWAMALTIMAMLVISPHTSLYDVLLLAMPAALTFDFNQTFARKSFPFAWLCLLGCYPVISWLLYFSENGGVVFQHWRLSYFNVLLLITLVLAYAQMFRRPSGGDTANGA